MIFCISIVSPYSGDNGPPLMYALCGKINDGEGWEKKQKQFILIKMPEKVHANRNENKQLMENFLLLVEH